MKILGETSIVNRKSQTNAKSRSQKSTIAIVASSARSSSDSSDEKKSEIFIILFTAQNKTGTRYKIKQNINKIFTRCLNEGKITISLKEPEVDIYIKSDPVQLNLFMRTLKLGLEGNHEAKSIGLSNISVTAAPLKSHPQKKLTIQARGDYPLKGFPRTITSLTITGIQRLRFDTQILYLTNLTHLDLSNNKIKKIPQKCGDLNLREINLSDNEFGNETEGCDWKWLEGEGLRKNLLSLNLTGNELKKLPSSLFCLRNLVTLTLTRNLIEQIPFAIQRLKSLRYFNISHNKLKTIPNILLDINLESIDISSNDFLKSYQPKVLNQFDDKQIKLWKIASQTVFQLNLPYSTENLPKSIVDILDRTPHCALCKKLCFSAIITRMPVFNIRFTAKTVVKDVESFPMDIMRCAYCKFKRRR